MEKIDKRGEDLLLRWGNKKRVRCVRVRDPDDPSFAGRIRRKVNSHFVAFSSDNENREPSLPVPPQSTRLTRNSEAGTILRSESNRNKLYSKPKISSSGGVEEESKSKSKSKSKHVWPKLYIALTSKEKEEDFMAMKGCKLPHRPKKRPKLIQTTLLLVSPGAWLTDMCQERYQVTEKNNTNKRPTGLKAMGSMESDSE